MSIGQRNAHWVSRVRQENVEKKRHVLNAKELRWRIKCETIRNPAPPFSRTATYLESRSASFQDLRDL